MRHLLVLAMVLAAPAALAADPPPVIDSEVGAGGEAEEADGAKIIDTEEGLQVIVGPGGTSLEAIAVPEARCVDGADASVCRLVTRVLRRDMTLSFFFEVLPPRSYLVAPDEEPLDDPSWPDWLNVGASYLIKARISGAGPWDAEFRLYSVTNRAAVAVEPQSFTGLSKGQLRDAAHRFANGVMKARTGKAGVFDTRIAYSQKLAPGVKGVGVVDMDGHDKDLLIANGSINMLPSWGFGGLLYTSFRDGHPELFFGKRKLSRDRGHYRRVAVSPDGSKMIASISYGGQSDLYLMSKDGQVEKNLTNSAPDEVSPTFSPDGSKVAFVSSATGAPQIYVMPAAGGEPTRLTHAGSYNYSPDWGPNGLIVFAGMEDGVSDIFTVNESGDIRRLTQNQGFNKDPSWSPDGRYIAFVSNRPAGPGIYLMSADGRYQSMIQKGHGYGNAAWER